MPDNNKGIEGGTIVEPGTKLYSSIRLMPVSGEPTRANDKYGDYDADFETGDLKDESRIDNVLIVFYDEDGKYVADFAGSTGNLGNSDDNYLIKRGNSIILENIEWGGVIPVTIEVVNSTRVEDINNYIVIVNYNPDLYNDLRDEGYITKYEDGKITEVTKTRSEFLSEVKVSDYQLGFTDKTKDYGFLMTTAGHYDAGGNYISYSTKPKTYEIFYINEKDAMLNPITAYVERLAVRVDFQYNNIEPVKVLYGTDVLDLTFKPSAWGVTATETESYLFKNLGTYEAQSNNYDDSYPSDFYAWTNYNNARIFWSESVNFNEELNGYPCQGTEYKEKKFANFPLKYLQYKNISNTLTNRSGKTYTLEHTFKNSELKAAINPYAVPTSVVLTGEYSVKYSGTDERPEENIKEGDLNLNDGGFYIRYVDMERIDIGKDEDSEDLYPENVYKYRLYREKGEKGENELLSALVKEQYRIWKLNGDKYEPCRDMDKFELINTNQLKDMVTGKYLSASNTWTLQLNKDLSGSVYLAEYNNESGSVAYKEVTSESNDSDKTASIAQANKFLQDQLGYAQLYDMAKAFFYAPIPHYSGIENPFPVNSSENDGNPYTGLFNYISNSINHNTGDFGVVRNHIYNIKINVIKDLGYGIPDVNIIPLPEPRYDHKLHQFNIELKILPWHIYDYTLDI